MKVLTSISLPLPLFLSLALRPWDLNWILGPEVSLSHTVCPTRQRKHQEIRAMRSQLKKIEDLGAAMEEALILDNKYTEHSTVGLAQQWDQLDQLGMRMQHNLEQQIQARY